MLELAASEMRDWDALAESARAERVKAEEQTVFSQSFAYVQHMMCMLCPLDQATSKRGGGGKRFGDDYENTSNSISNSMAESDSIDAESGFEDQEIPDSGQQVSES
jgi:myotubularin-related protein 5/13